MEYFGASGTIASIAGLAISIWLIFITRGARKAVQEAKCLINSRNLVVELRELMRILEQALIECDYGRRRSVKIILTSCSQKVSYFRTKFRPELKGRRNLVYIANDLDNLLDRLNKNDCETLETEEKYWSQENIGKMLKYFHSELGHFDAKDIKEI